MRLLTSISFRMAAIALLAVTASAAKADEKLPKADQLLNRHIEATGGAAAYKKLKTRKMVGTVKAKMGGHPEHEAKITVRAKAPDCWRLDVTSDLVSLIRGCAKKAAWESREGGETRELEGVEKEQSLEQARFNAALQWRKLYTKVETVGVEKLDGKDAYKVQIDTKSGAQLHHWYDKATGRLVQSSRTAVGPAGEFKVVSQFTDYEKFDGVWVATKMNQKLKDIPGIGDGTQAWSYDEISHNEEISDKIFTSPKSE